jgi:hypothetical protein
MPADDRTFGIRGCLTELSLHPRGALELSQHRSIKYRYSVDVGRGQRIPSRKGVIWPEDQKGVFEWQASNAPHADTMAEENDGGGMPIETGTTAVKSSPRARRAAGRNPNKAAKATTLNRVRPKPGRRMIHRRLVLRGVPHGLRRSSPGLQRPALVHEFTSLSGFGTRLDMQPSGEDMQSTRLPRNPTPFQVVHRFPRGSLVSYFRQSD